MNHYHFRTKKFYIPTPVQNSVCPTSKRKSFNKVLEGTSLTQCHNESKILVLIELTLPDLRILLPTSLSGGGGRSVPLLLTHEPFDLRTSNFMRC